MSQSFRTSAAVCQGASTNCLLFTFFIESTIDAVATNGHDGLAIFTLSYEDDTVVTQATSRKQIYVKC